MKSNKLTAISGGHGSKIGRRLEPAIIAILTSDSLPTAARSIGVHENTLARWMKDPTFSKRLKAARSTMFVHAMGLLQNSATEAAQTLLNIMRDKKTPVTARLHAAQMILQHAKKEERGVPGSTAHVQFSSQGTT